MYREQEFVERCFCDAPATLPCGSCGRARCSRHVARGLCNRCTQFIGRELDQRTSLRWWGTGVFGTSLALVMMAAGAVYGVLVALPLSVAMYFAARELQRARLIKRMGPGLSASKGELPPAPRAPISEANTGSGLPPGVGKGF